MIIEDQNPAPVTQKRIPVKSVSYATLQPREPLRRRLPMKKLEETPEQERRERRRDMQRKRKLESLHAMVAAEEPESAGQRLESAGSFRSTSKSEEAKKYKQK